MLSHLVLTLGRSVLRMKIESIVRKGGTKDADCPECLESIKYWCRVGSEFKEREKVSQRAQATMNVEASHDLTCALVDGPTLHGSSTPSTISSLAPPEASNALSLASTLLSARESGANAVAPKGHLRPLFLASFLLHVDCFFLSSQAKRKQRQKQSKWRGKCRKHMLSWWKTAVSRLRLMECIFIAVLVTLACYKAKKSRRS